MAAAYYEADSQRSVRDSLPAARQRGHLRAQVGPHGPRRGRRARGQPGGPQGPRKIRRPAGQSPAHPSLFAVQSNVPFPGDGQAAADALLLHWGPSVDVSIIYTCRHQLLQPASKPHSDFESFAFLPGWLL
eukprot:scaffold9_cov29-Prasinocladus_malaysianus.AAC.1